MRLKKSFFLIVLVTTMVLCLNGCNVKSTEGDESVALSIVDETVGTTADETQNETSDEISDETSDTSVDASSDDSYDIVGGVELADPIKVAEALETCAVSGYGALAMNPIVYFEEVLELKSAWSFNADEKMHKFKGENVELALLQGYVELLCTKYSFELATEPYREENEYSWGKKGKFEYVLLYTGGETMLGGTVGDGEYTETVGDVSIYGEYKIYFEDQSSEVTVEMEYDGAISLPDHGYRADGSQKELQYVGDSFGAGLWKNADGSFETTDGRMKTRVGEAMLITDGEESICSVQMNLYAPRNLWEIYITNPYGVTQAWFRFPYTRVHKTGNLYGAEEFFSNDTAKIYDTVSKNALVDPGLSGDGCYVLHGEAYLVPMPGMYTEMKALNMRVMYTDNEVLVLYYCAQFVHSPYQTEGLVAIPLGEYSGNTSDTGANGVYTVKVGDTIEIDGPTAFDSMYHLYTWYYSAGSEFSELHDTNLHTCTLIARKPGTVRLKLKYEYTEEGKNVLTGRTEDQATSSLYEYVIHIVE